MIWLLIALSVGVRSVRLQADQMVGVRSVGLQADQNIQADAERGKQTYLKIGCYQCHGRAGQGAATGPRLGPPPPLALEAFTRYVRHPRGEMPPYAAKVVSDAALADVYGYLRSLPPPLPASALPLPSAR